MSVGAVETVKKPENTPQGSEGNKETKDYYAWANIDFGAEADESGWVMSRKIIKYGEKVSQKDLGISDEEWDKLVNEDRVIRKSVPPETGQYESPKRRMLANAKKAMELAAAGGE